jgi:hypothetical protein
VRPGVATKNENEFRLLLPNFKLPFKTAHDPSAIAFEVIPEAF